MTTLVSPITASELHVFKRAIQAFDTMNRIRHGHKDAVSDEKLYAICLSLSEVVAELALRHVPAMTIQKPPLRKSRNRVQ